MKKTEEIIRKGVHEVLDEYLCGQLMRDLESKIVSSVMYDLVKNDLLVEQSDFKDCVNELCLKCGNYHEEHNGACDGCRWLKPRRGW